MYKTETHLHTSEVSRCGKLNAADMIARYHSAGYSTVFVSDHFSEKFFGLLGDMPWEDKIARFLTGYRLAKEIGDRLGVCVLLSAELRLTENANDYLLYGVDEEFLLACRDIFSLSIAEFCRFAREHHVTVIQAHPMRDGKCTPMPQDVDGVEVYNSNPRHENFSGDVLALAKEHGLLITSGSDAHRVEDIAGGGILSDSPVTSAEEYIALLRSGHYRCIGAAE